MFGSRAAWSLLALAVMGSGVPLCARETDPGRAPTGAVTRPGDLLKEADGICFDDYFLSPNASPFGPGYVGGWTASHRRYHLRVPRFGPTPRNHAVQNGAATAGVPSI